MIDNVVKKSAIFHCTKNDVKREYTCLEYRPQERVFKFEYSSIHECDSNLVRRDGYYNHYSEAISIKLPYLQFWKVQRNVGEQFPPLALTCTKEAFTENSLFYQPYLPNWVSWCRPCVGQTSSNPYWTYEEAIKLFWTGINVCSSDYIFNIRNNNNVEQHFANGWDLHTTLKQFYSYEY